MSFKVIVVGNSSCMLAKKNGPKIDTYDYVVRMGECRVRGYEAHVGTKTDMYRAKWFNLFNCENIHTEEEYGTLRNLDFKFRDLLFNNQDSDIYSEIAYSPICRDYYTNSLRLTCSHIPFLPRYANRYFCDYITNLCSFNKCKNVYFFNTDMLVQLMLEMKISQYAKNTNHMRIMPSAGICTIYFLLQHFKDADITITGFDNFQTGHYWKPNIPFRFTTHSSYTEHIYIRRLLKKDMIRLL
jgi:hypothetical protein